MKKIARFETNAGMLFQFQLDRYNIVYASSDINKVRDDLLYTEIDFDSERYVDRELLIEGDKYKVVLIGGYLNSSTICDFPELLRGVKNKYSYVMVFTVVKVE